MKIKLELPDWVDERHIRIFAGSVELVAYKLAHEDFWNIKVDRCIQCGECCTNLSELFHEPVKDGVCVHLKPVDRFGKRECAKPMLMSRMCASANSKKCKHVTYCKEKV